MVANEGRLTVALDVSITDELREEGIARELVNRIQNLRKDSGFDVTDKIKILIEKNQEINSAVTKHSVYIGSQTLAIDIDLVENLPGSDAKVIELDEKTKIRINILKA